jgi:hypothetical protein
VQSVVHAVTVSGETLFEAAAAAIGIASAVGKAIGGQRSDPPHRPSVTRACVRADVRAASRISVTIMLFASDDNPFG